LFFFSFFFPVAPRFVEFLGFPCLFFPFLCLFPRPRKKRSRVHLHRSLPPFPFPFFFLFFLFFGGEKGGGWRGFSSFLFFFFSLPFRPGRAVFFPPFFFFFSSSFFPVKASKRKGSLRTKGRYALPLSLSFPLPRSREARSF